MARLWPANVNSRFYGLTTTRKNNLVRIEYESGRESTHLKNSTGKKTHSFKLSLRTREEEVNFWEWYDKSVLSGSLSFILTDLVSQQGQKEYKFTSEPSVAEGSYPKECTMNVREV